MSFELDRKKKKKLIKDGMPSLEANELSKTYDWELISETNKEIRYDSIIRNNGGCR